MIKCFIVVPVKSLVLILKFDYYLYVRISKRNSVARNCAQLCEIARNSCAELCGIVRNCAQFTGLAIERK